MNKNEAVAIAANTATILNEVHASPKRAADFVEAMLLKDPGRLMKMWSDHGNFLPFNEFDVDGEILTYIRLEDLRFDEAKMGVIKRLWLHEGKKVEAIKQARIWTGAGLKDSKDFVESL